jgi:ketosteroid isomerase-like protein
MPSLSSNPADLQRQVADTERAFAKSMADRDHAAFSTFLSDEAVFMSGPQPLRGKARVASAWKRFYEGSTAPFSWQPEQVEVLPSGTLAISSGPVRDPQGKLIATFTSIWRLEAPGVWRIVFDKGNDVCDCPAP